MNEEIKNYIDQKIREHTHKGTDGQRINLFDIFGLVETVTTAPAGRPTSFSDQFKIFDDGADLRLYWYDSVNHEWHYATGT